jgi:hypothetical protein
MKKILYLILFLTTTGSISAQQKTQVVTRKIERTIAVKPGDRLEVKGEKARIKIESHAKNEILLEVRFTAKNPDQQMAEKELQYMRYGFQHRKNQVYINNYFVIPKNTKTVHSNLQVELILLVPANMQLQVSNYFGNTTISNHAGAINAISEYGVLSLNNLSGIITTNLNFSDLKINNCGNIQITANNSDIEASGFSGRILMTGENSDIEIQSSGTISGNIQVKNGNIRISGLLFDRQALELLSPYGEIDAPALKASGNKEKVLHQVNMQFPLLKANTTFGKIQIR